MLSMSRPLRIEFPGALYHVTARGDRREDIFVDDADRARLLTVVAQGLERFNAARSGVQGPGSGLQFQGKT